MIRRPTPAGWNLWPLVSLALIFGIIRPIHAQEFETFDDEIPPPQHLIDLPTAGVLSRGTGSMELRVFSGGGLLGGIYAGVSNRLLLGISFGGSNLLGTGDVVWNPRPEVAIKYLLISETEMFPAVSVGFESQGYGPYDDNLNRYQVKSRGFYGVLSRNFMLAGMLGLHAGINYSVENKDQDSRVNLFFGADKSINQHLTVMIEYDLARNDGQRLSGFGKDKGYLNLGARVTLGGRFGLEFDLRNLLDNRVGSVSPSRELKILYTEPLGF